MADLYRIALTGPLLTNLNQTGTGLAWPRHNWANYGRPVPDSPYRPIIDKSESNSCRHNMIGPQLGQLWHTCIGQPLQAHYGQIWIKAVREKHNWATIGPIIADLYWLTFTGPLWTNLNQTGTGIAWLGSNWANYVKAVPGSLYRPTIDKSVSNRCRHSMIGPQMRPIMADLYRVALTGPLSTNLNQTSAGIAWLGHNWASYSIPVPGILYRPIIDKSDSKWCRKYLIGPPMVQLWLTCTGWPLQTHHWQIWIKPVQA